jgi:hypothetical protein
LPGYPANVYWAYHALLALVVQVLGTPIPLASILLNVFSLFVVLILAVQILDRLQLLPRTYAAASLAAVFVPFGTNLRAE